MTNQMTTQEFIQLPLSAIIRHTITALQQAESQPDAYVLDMRYYIRRVTLLDKPVIAVDFGGAVLSLMFGVSPERWDELVDSEDEFAPEMVVAHALMDLQLGSLTQMLRELGRPPQGHELIDALEALGDEISFAFDHTWHLRRAEWSVYLGVAEKLEAMGL